MSLKTEEIVQAFTQGAAAGRTCCQHAPACSMQGLRVRISVAKSAFSRMIALAWGGKARGDAPVSFAPPHDLVRLAPWKSPGKIGHHLFHGLHARCCCLLVARFGRMVIHFGCHAESAFVLVVSVLRHVRRQRLVTECHVRR
jgi:hypothetical protein